MKLLALAMVAVCGWAADLCPTTGPKRCAANQVTANDTVKWPAAGIEEASVAGQLDVTVCCFRRQSIQPEKRTIGDKETMVPTHREDPKAAGKQEEEDDFPDLIEEDAHGRAVSIRGTLGDADQPVKVDVLLRCTASKFADQYAFQFTVINRSDRGVDVDWDHLRQVRANSSPSMQPVAGGMAYVFLTAKKPHEALAIVEVKRGSRMLGRFRFDGFTLTQ
jgi:hypothetical protein